MRVKKNKIVVVHDTPTTSEADETIKYALQVFCKKIINYINIYLEALNLAETYKTLKKDMNELV